MFPLRLSSQAVRLACVLCLEAMAGMTMHAGTYPRLEAAFSLSVATDPFDYAATDVRVQLQQPNGSTISLPAFYDGGTTWRLRHAPRAAGNYQITGITLNGSAAAYSGLTATNWSYAGPPTGPGYIRVDPANPRKFITDDGRRYFPIGHNVCWNPSVSNDFPRIFQRMGAARENWTRIWMTHFWESLNLDWPKVDNTYGKLNLAVARRWDLMVDEAEKAGVAMQVVLQHHGQYSTNVNPNWNENPYNTANGGFLSDATQFFTNATAKALTKRKLRYAVARWGCSPSIMAWELWNEVQFTAAAYANQWTNIAAWHAEMAAFLRAQDPYGHLVTTSSELSKDYWGAMDYYQNHNYATDLLSSSRDAATPPTNAPVKPIFDGESGGVYDIPRLWPQPLIWGGIMAAQGGTSCPWWWDTIDPQNEYFLFKSGSDYLGFSGLPYQDNLVKSAPRITGAPLGTLTFSPGGTWQVVTKDVFVVNEGVPDGISTATPFLHGSWHHVDMRMTNGYRFLVDYPQAGTFAVQVRETSTYGNSNLRILVDGALKTNVLFYATNGGPTNVTFSVAVTSGPHTVTLTNAANDWLVLGDLSLAPYVSELGAYAVGNTNFQSAWVWHRANLYNTNATSSISGSVAVRNLQAGTYAASWWDAYNGGVLSQFTVVIPTNGATVAVPTPLILRSAALTVGKAPGAALSGPALSQTLTTNSPAVYTALTLTNPGGLPLAYSLSLTGLSSVTYGALHSRQAGGPAYAWRDVSAYGRDISDATNWTALTAKNARDEGIAGPFSLGFEFPFFHGASTPGAYPQVYVSPNGFVTFSPFTGDRGVNSGLPNAAAPTNLVALFWDDLDLSTGGKIWIAGDPLAGEFTVQYDAVRFKGSALTVTAQLVLRSTGEMLAIYKALGRTNTCTVGLQDASGTKGLTVTQDSAAYLQSGLAVRLSPAPWLQLDRPAGLVPGGKAETIDFAFSPAGLAPGTYTASLLFRTADASQPLLQRPVSLNVYAGTPIESWRQTWFGSPFETGSGANQADPDGDGLANFVEYAFNTNPTNANPSPLSYAVTGDQFRLSFGRKRPAPAEVVYVVEVTDNLATGTWNSGAAYYTQTVTDLGNGTESVVTTLSGPVSATNARFVRVRLHD